MDVHYFKRTMAHTLLYFQKEQNQRITQSCFACRFNDTWAVFLFHPLINTTLLEKYYQFQANLLLFLHTQTHTHFTTIFCILTCMYMHICIKTGAMNPLLKRIRFSPNQKSGPLLCLLWIHIRKVHLCVIYVQYTYVTTRARNIIGPKRKLHLYNMYKYVCMELDGD